MEPQVKGPEDLSNVIDEIPITGIDVYPVEGGYTHSFHVDRRLFGLIIGKGGNTLMSIQRDTGTKIDVPRGSGAVEITGSTRAAVSSARNRIDSIVEKSRRKQKFTHFLAIPMNEKGITENYAAFKNTVLNDTGKDSKGVWDGIFQKPEKMHLTLGIMLLLSDTDIKAAVDTLEECKENIVIPTIEEHGPIKIKAQGLGCFNRNPAKLRVLYGAVSTENDILYEMSQKIADCFVEKGLMKREKLTLHLTLMNVSYVKDKNRSGRRIENFDATNIMEVHKDYLFGESIMKTIQICELGEKTEDGYWKITSKIELAL